MIELVEGTRAGQYLMSEANGTRSRDKAMLMPGLNLLAGAVLGRVAAANEPAPIVTAGAANVGNGVFMLPGVEVAAGTKVGGFRVVMTSAGATAAFSVTDPDGVALTAGAVGTAYAQAELPRRCGGGHERHSKVHRPLRRMPGLLGGRRTIEL